MFVFSYINCKYKADSNKIKVIVDLESNTEELIIRVMSAK